VRSDEHGLRRLQASGVVEKPVVETNLYNYVWNKYKLCCPVYGGKRIKGMAASVSSRRPLMVRDDVEQ